MTLLNEVNARQDIVIDNFIRLIFIIPLFFFHKTSNPALPFLFLLFNPSIKALVWINCPPTRIYDYRAFFHFSDSWCVDHVPFDQSSGEKK